MCVLCGVLRAQSEQSVCVFDGVFVLVSTTRVNVFGGASRSICPVCVCVFYNISDPQHDEFSHPALQLPVELPHIL